MRIDDFAGGKIKHGSDIFEMVEAKFNGTVVWPLNTVYTYVIVTPVTWHWSTGSILRADGGNCVYFTADVQKKQGNTVVETLSGVTLTPVLDSETSYYLSGNTVWGHDLYKTVTAEHNEQVTLTYQTASTTVTIYQQANVRTVTRTVYGNWSETSRRATGNPYDYHISISANRYILSTSSDVCPASGGSASLFFPTGSCYHYQDYNVTQTRTVTQYCTYTATGSTEYAEPQSNQTQVVSDSVQVQDNLTSSAISGSGTGFSRSGYNITISTRGKVTGSQRYADYTATNGNATATVRVYQEANAFISTSSVQHVSCSFHDYSQGDLLPATGGQFRIDYTSTVDVTEVYTSGSYTETEPLTSTVQDLLNCSTLTSQVSGSGYFNITVGRNSGGSRYVSLTLRYDTTYYQTIGLWQDANAEAIAATLNPYIYQRLTNTGRVAFRLTVDSADMSKVTWPVTVNNIVLNITPSGSSTVSSSFSEIVFDAPTGGNAYSEYMLPTSYSRFSGESGVAQVVKDSTKPTSDQVTDFTCEQISYSIL